VRGVERRTRQGCSWQLLLSLESAGCLYTDTCYWSTWVDSPRHAGTPSSLPLYSCGRHRHRRHRRHRHHHLILFFLSFCSTLFFFSRTFPKRQQPYARWYAVFRVICHVLAYSNSCVNPFIYHYVSADFRRSLAIFLAPLCRRRGGRLGRAATSSAIVGIELGTTHPPESGFIAGARSAVFVAPGDQDDNRIGSMSLVAVHNTSLQAHIHRASPASNDDANESTESRFRVGRPSNSA